MPRILPRTEPIPGMIVPPERARAISRLCQKGIITPLQANELRATTGPLPKEAPIVSLTTDFPGAALIGTQSTGRRPYNRTGKDAKKTPPVVDAPEPTPGTETSMALAPVASTDAQPSSIRSDFERIALAALPPVDLAWSAEEMDCWISVVVRLVEKMATL